MKTLSLEKMENVEGGVSRSEYCATLAMIICNNPVTQAMADAWNLHCAPYGYGFPCTEIRE